MSLVFDRRNQFGDKPGTHALICGISAYPHLGGGTGKPSRFDFGFTQLTSAARSAYEVHRWLIEQADLVPPLSTCRLLLAPTPGEVPTDTDEGLPQGELPTLNNFLRSASNWREDAAAHPDGMTILYIAGHGFGIGQIDQVFLLHDFGDGLGSILRNSIKVGSMSQGMSPSSLFPGMARKQLFFIDTGFQFVRLTDEFAGAYPSDVYDVSLSTTEDRAAVTFQASAPEQVAYGTRGGLTLFAEVLLDSLAGGAAELIDGSWSVTTAGLASKIPEEVRRISHERGISQDVTVSGLIRNLVVAQLPTPPTVDVLIDVPDHVKETTTISVLTGNMEVIFNQEAPLPHGPISLQLPAGLYLVQATKSDQTSVQQIASIMPPMKKIYMEVG